MCCPGMRRFRGKMSEALKCKCMCGEVRFSATPTNMEMGACHCTMCSKWAGGVFLNVSCDTVVFEDESKITAFKSSEWGERVFCTACGSTLVWRTRDKKHNGVSVQAFENPGQFEFTHQIFVDNKPDNYAFANKTAMKTEAEIMAMFTPAPEGNANG